jgi:hypothetical protein
MCGVRGRQVELNYVRFWAGEVPSSPALSFHKYADLRVWISVKRQPEFLMRNLYDYEARTAIRHRKVACEKFWIFAELFDLVLFNKNVVYVVLS